MAWRMLAAWMACLVTGTAAAQARVELIPFESRTISDADLLAGRMDRGVPAILGGELTVPLEPEGRMPVVVLLHGSAGVFPYVTQWRDELAAMGIASFVIDSFSARGIRGTIADQDRLARLNAIVDAYAALSIKVYPGAHHVFMWRDLREPTVLKQAQTTRACQLRERDDGMVVNSTTGAAFTHADPCVAKGPTVGYNAAAAEDARKSVRAVLEALRQP
ncbi:MAG: hypothetical protein ACM3SO_17095 [Betaproteobacteria bacterium]